MCNITRKCRSVVKLLLLLFSVTETVKTKLMNYIRLGFGCYAYIFNARALGKMCKIINDRVNFFPHFIIMMQKLLQNVFFFLDFIAQMKNRARIRN